MQLFGSWKSNRIEFMFIDRMSHWFGTSGTPASVGSPKIPWVWPKSKPIPGPGHPPCQKIFPKLISYLRYVFVCVITTSVQFGTTFDNHNLRRYVFVCVIITLSSVWGNAKLLRDPKIKLKRILTDSWRAGFDIESLHNLGFSLFRVLTHSKWMGGGSAVTVTLAGGGRA